MLWLEAYFKANFLIREIFKHLKHKSSENSTVGSMYPLLNFNNYYYVVDFVLPICPALLLFWRIF